MMSERADEPNNSEMGMKAAQGSTGDDEYEGIRRQSLRAICGCRSEKLSKLSKSGLKCVMIMDIQDRLSGRGKRGKEKEGQQRKQ